MLIDTPPMYQPRNIQAAAPPPGSVPGTRAAPSQAVQEVMSDPKLAQVFQLIRSLLGGGQESGAMENPVVAALSEPPIPLAPDRKAHGVSESLRLDPPSVGGPNARAAGDALSNMEGARMGGMMSGKAEAPGGGGGLLAALIEALSNGSTSHSPRPGMEAFDRLRK